MPIGKSYWWYNERRKTRTGQEGILQCKSQKNPLVESVQKIEYRVARLVFLEAIKWKCICTETEKTGEKGVRSYWEELWPSSSRAVCIASPVTCAKERSSVESYEVELMFSRAEHIAHVSNTATAPSAARACGPAWGASACCRRPRGCGERRARRRSRAARARASWERHDRCRRAPRPPQTPHAAVGPVPTHYTITPSTMAYNTLRNITASNYSQWYYTFESEARHTNNVTMCH